VLLLENTLDENNLVEKSKSLVWAKFKDYTAGELKLLETYLSRINARDPESTRVVFSLREYADLMGVPDLRADQVKPYTQHLLGNVVSIPTGENKGKLHKNDYTQFTLFTMADCSYSDEEKRFLIKISCNPELKNVFFSLSEDGYIKYRLRYTLKMGRQYSILLYGLLRDMIYKQGGWQIKLDALRDQLSATEKSYQDYRAFCRRVLNPAIEEINEVSDIQASFTKITKGRKVVAIHFFASFKPSLKQQEREAAFAEKLDFAAIMPEIELHAAAVIAEKVQKDIQKQHPEIKKADLDSATKDTLKAAYRAAFPQERDFPDNPAGYLWRIISRPEAIDDFMPYSYIVES
jgi:hypothetical protein